MSIVTSSDKRRVSPSASASAHFTRNRAARMILGRAVRGPSNVERKGGLMVRMWRVLCGAVVALHSMAGVVLAQDPARLPGEEPGWLNYMVVVGLAVVVCATTLINPKRSHLT